MEYILSVAIPTYNRAFFLSEALGRLIDAVSGYNNVEVLVCDNASTDATSEVCSRYFENKNFSYFRQVENLGFDRNYLFCLEQSRGRYVWVVGDDDYIADGAVGRVLSSLSEFAPSVLVFNGAHDHGVARIKRTSGCDLLYDFNDFIFKYGWHFTWISTTIYRRSDILELTDEKLLGSKHFVHMSLLLNSFLKGGKFVFDFEPLVWTKGNVSDYSKSYVKSLEIFSEYLCRIADMYSGGLRLDASRSFLFGHYDNLGLFRPGFFIKARLEGALDCERLEYYMPFIKRTSRSSFFARLIFSLPVWVSKSVLFVWVFFKR